MWGQKFFPHRWWLNDFQRPINEQILVKFDCFGPIIGLALCAVLHEHNNRVTMIKLFGADGIRGKVDHSPFQSEDLDRLGRCLAAWWLDRYPSPTILLGTDTREASQRMKTALVGGLTRGGVEVLDGEILPTAAVSNLITSLPDVNGGIVITASHNPIIEDGIKVFDHNGCKLNNEEELELETLFFDENSRLPYATRSSQLWTMKNASQKYATALAHEFLNLERYPYRLLIDCANGASYYVAQLLFSKLDLRAAYLNVSPDGTNINRNAGSEYVRRRPERFFHEMLRHQADLGLAFDGDADRVVIVDQEGRFYDGDMLLSIMAFHLRAQQELKGNAVVTTQMSNNGLIRHLNSNGIHTNEVRNGDKYITDRLLEQGFTLGGEQIGHIIVQANSQRVTGDGLYTALWVLAALAQNPGVSLYELTYGLRKWPQVNLSAYLGDRIFHPAQEIPGLELLKEQVRQQIPDLSRFECRAASTEPVYRIMLEAEHTSLKQLTKLALRLAKHVQKELDKQDQPIEVLDCVNGGVISHLA